MIYAHIMMWLYIMLRQKKTDRHIANLLIVLLNHSRLIKIDFGDFVSFTNYIQYFLPHWQTYLKNCSDRDAKALIEIIRSLQPDIIFIWGCVINQHIQRSFSKDIKVIENTDGYIWNWQVDDKVITVINTYHPTYPSFNDNGRLSQYVRQIFLK